MSSANSFSSLYSSGTAGTSGTQWFPDPFLDYSGTYMPQNIRTMLKWCELLWANNGTYRMALERVCSYFLTKVEISDVDDEVKVQYEEFLSDTLRVSAQLRMVGLDFLFYGNSFTSVFYPFRRYLRCAKCNFERPIEKMTYKFVKFRFSALCPKCHLDGEHLVADRRSMEQDKLRIVRWNPHNMDIMHHPLSHDTQYLYRIPDDFKAFVTQGKPFYLQYTPWEFIEAIRDDTLFKFNDGVVFHLKEDTLAGLQNRGWGLPRALSNFKQGYYIQVLKRYNEALALDYVVPWRVISPASPRGGSGGGGLDPLLGANLGNFSSKIRSMIGEHRRDPLALHSLPFPVEYQVLGGEAAALAPHELLTAGLDELLNACGVPAELYRGSLSLQAAPTALRLFEATWPHLVAGFNNWLNWLLENISMALNWARAKARLTPVMLADDVEARVIKLQLSAAQKISDQTALAPFGINIKDEIKRVFDEQRMMREEQLKMQKEEEQAQEMQRRLSDLGQGGADMPMDAGGMPLGGMPLGGMPLGGVAGTPARGTPGDILDKADQISRQLLDMPEGERRRQLAMLRKTDETLHAVVKERLSRNRSQARSIGQDQVLSQMTGQAPTM